MTTLICNATIVNEGIVAQGSVLIEDNQIAAIIYGSDAPLPQAHHTINATGCYLLPGAIDCHVHSREPGLTHKGSLCSESAAAAAGGVTTIFDMPNVVPQTTSLHLLNERYQLAAGHCHTNYAFYLGATHDNLSHLCSVDTRRIPGIKLFMGSSTGNMLVDKRESLEAIFRHCPTLIMTHCEDISIVNANMERVAAETGTNDPAVQYHPIIRSEEACLASTQLAIELAEQYEAELHIAHLTTAQEVRLLDAIRSPRITAEACVAHLLFTADDYATLGTRIKCNPAVKAAPHRKALRQAIQDGTINIVSTDHAPHLLSDKEGGCRKAASGMPMVQFSLPAMLTLADEGIVSIPRVVELMCHNPARRFGVVGRGFIRTGYQADLTLVRHEPQTISDSQVQSLCQWTPLAGRTLHWQVAHTWVNGHHTWNGHTIHTDMAGQAVAFRR